MKFDSVESIIKDSRYYKYYDCYKWLIELGFDFDKNSAQDFIDCLLYLYYEKYGEEVPF